MLPLAGGDAAGDVQLSPRNNGLISLTVRDASLSRVLSLLAQTQHLNIVAANDIDAMISITLRDVPLEEALTAILSVANYTWVQRNNVILVTSLADANNLPPDVQGRQIQVFDLDFASADAVAEAVTNFLSPIGKVTTSKSDSANNRRTRELVIVEDVPESVARIAAYIHQVDCPPRQVLIEAHILQVRLSDDMRCGVDFHALCRLAGSDINVFSLPGIASATAGGGLGIPTPESPSFVATFTSTDLQAVIEALETTTDSKSLGSPKLLVLNGQEARIQVGETIYFSQTTTTETSTQQGASSVQTGVILRITPRITQDCRVLLHVAPEVSSPSGERESPDLPPNIATIELQSDVMLRDGEGMIIGGLIDERDVTNQQKVPYLGDVRGIGWAFRHTRVEKERREVIFALIPRVQPYNQQSYEFEQGELAKTGVPLYEGPLKRVDRPWDPILPDGKRVYKRLIPAHKRPGYWPSEYGSNAEYVIPPYPLPQQKFYAPQCAPGQELQQPQGNPFLSDEALPVPPTGVSGQQDVEIITDQQ
jgi:type II secretory pathway component GspD/PulD (secretin)